MAKVLWDGGVGTLTPEEQAERNRAALAYQAAIDESRIAFALAGVCALAAVAVLVKTYYYPSYTSNKGHRVPRNRKATIQVFASGGRGLGSRVASAAWSAGATGQRGGSGGNVTDTFTVPMVKASEVMSKLRRKFAREIASGKLRIKLVREGKWHRGRRVGKGA